MRHWDIQWLWGLVSLEEIIRIVVRAGIESLAKIKQRAQAQGSQLTT